MSVDTLLRGRGTFVADLLPEGVLHAAFVRSPFAHARIRAIDAAAARDADGVIAVLTATDLGPVKPLVSPVTVSGEGRFLAPIKRPILCAETVRHVGDPVALVVATSESAAADAAELVEVDYDPLAAVGQVTARGEGREAAEIDPAAPGNVALRWIAGDWEAVEAAFARADRVAAVEIDQARVAPTPLETRGVLAVHDAATGRLTLEIPTQGSAMLAGH